MIDLIKPYHATCPVYDNPILLVGLFKSEQESHGRKPYGRHYRGDVDGLAVYDELAYQHCPYANPLHVNNGDRREPTDPTGLAMYRIMRTQFDRVVRAWEVFSGIHMSAAYAENMLLAWRNDEGWRYYDATYQNLPQMLFWAAMAQNLVGRYILADSPLARMLAKMPQVDLIPGHGGYLQVGKTGNMFLELEFLLLDRRIHVQGEHYTESFGLSVMIHGKPAFPDLTLDVDPDWLAHMKAFDHDHRDRRLLDIADRILA
ncbi:hypothetical protein CSQ85_11820 [Bifidobacterium rousetti]|nr:hypothetical protein CSQ85_11820 [Bifidobacterium rousetti]